MSPNIIKVKELAQRFELTESTICNLTARGELPGFRIGKSWRINMNKIIKWAAEPKLLAPQKG